MGIGTEYFFCHNADTFEAMLAMAGGDRRNLERGFDTALQTGFIMTFLLEKEL